MCWCLSIIELKNSRWNIETRYVKWAVSLTLRQLHGGRKRHRYPMRVGSDEPQSQSGRFEEEKILLSFSRIELWIVQFVALSLYWLRILSKSGDLLPNTRLKKTKHNWKVSSFRDDYWTKEKAKHNWKVSSFRDDYWTKEKAKEYVMNSESLPQKFYACRWNSIGRVVATRRPPRKQKLTSKQWNHGSMLHSNSHHASRHKKMCRLWSYPGKQIR